MLIAGERQTKSWHLQKFMQVCPDINMPAPFFEGKHEKTELVIEVRDSRTGYLVPGRDGPGLLPDWESCWDAVAAAAVTWKFRLTFWLGNYIWSFQIGF